MKHIKLCLVVLLLTIPLAQALDQNNSSFQFNFNSYMIPHPEKAHRGGEDAYFNSSHLLIVADGVGGWNNQGVDPSKAEDYLKEDFIKYTSSPLSLIKRAQKENDHVGSSTMVVGSLFNNELRYCYIGDSGFMLIRRYEKLISIFEYVEQQHRFNFPFQLSQKAYGGDDPDTSICGSIQVKNGDILVFGSDGLFDNMEFSEILREVRRADADDTLLTTLAKNLAETSISRGSDPVFNSPFAKRAKLENLVFEGGKLDDTTVIVAQIVNNWR